MPVDNDVYERLGDSWWDETSPLSLLHGSVTPGRFAYFREVLTKRSGAAPGGLTVLDIGCGGGFLAEQFAALGCHVTGVDPSPASIGTARAHAAARGLRIDYRVGAGEELPVQDAAFDVACCCDVLEHVADVDRVISETARVLKPGGLYLFDTVNRTRLSRLVMIKLCQDWSRTGWMPRDLHDWSRFITPDELRSAAAGAGLAIREITGMAPGIQPPQLYLLLRQLKKARIDHAEFGRRSEFVLTPDLRVTYIGYATKAP